MTFALRWTEHAVGQLGAIAEHISLVSPVYAEQLLDRIVQRLRQAQAFPESGRRVPEAATLGVRELIDFPYRLIYRVHGDTVEVVAVVHGRQDLIAHLPR
ncbi:MAG TPA: type II toxin-antitoxin system RelE/ParE family toxin [Gemmatimonadaceae bacterium]|nr:type II toxin-antitoxin system RelE/ParE family toxin [Gemmatimonadaceae bacterium]